MYALKPMYLDIKTQPQKYKKTKLFYMPWL